MAQLALPMLTHYSGPRLLPMEKIYACKSYREAVRLCWLERTRTRMTKSVLAEECGCYASHVTDYLSDSDSARDLPGKHIAKWEVSCGNRAVNQWLTWQAQLTHLETFIQPQQQEQRAA